MRPIHDGNASNDTSGTTGSKNTDWRNSYASGTDANSIAESAHDSSAKETEIIEKPKGRSRSRCQTSYHAHRQAS